MKLTIDGREVEVPPGSTILNAARSLGIDVPTLCFLEGYRPSTSCLVCVVRVRGRNGFVPSCATLAEDGMEVQSETPEVHQVRKMALELLLSDHDGVCRGAAKCKLRRHARRYGVNPGCGPRVAAARREELKSNDQGPMAKVQGGDSSGIMGHGALVIASPPSPLLPARSVIYEPGLCVNCGLCIQIVEAAKGPLGLTFVGRGFDVRVGVPFDRPLEEALGRVAAECIAACPTAALAWKDGPPTGRGGKQTGSSEQ